jgi:hypothetical protein
MGEQLNLELLPAGDELLALIANEGFRNVRSCGPAGVCATRRLLFSSGLFTRLTLDGYGGRYCYETEAEAIEALQAWDGTADPPGQWVKHKFARGERLGPGSSMDL